MQRRSFLAGAVVGLAGLRRACAGQHPRRVTFAFSLYGMRSLPLDEALRACAKIGYDAVELAVMPEWHADPARLNKEQRRGLRDRLAELRLALPALMENLPLTVDDKTHRLQLDRSRAAAELGRELSPAAPPLIETILGGRPGEWDKLKNQFVQRLGQFAEVMASRQTILAVKPHRGQAMNLPEHALWLLEQVKSSSIKLAYDYSHFQFRKLSIAETLKAMLPQTRFIHVKDVREEKGRTEFLLPGDGTIDYAELFRRLREANYQDCVCVEVSGQIHQRKGYDPLTTARRCYENLAPRFAQAGLR